MEKFQVTNAYNSKFLYSVSCLVSEPDVTLRKFCILKQVVTACDVTWESGTGRGYTVVAEPACYFFPKYYKRPKHAHIHARDL